MVIVVTMVMLTMAMRMKSRVEGKRKASRAMPLHCLARGDCGSGRFRRRSFWTMIRNENGIFGIMECVG
jgi:hypothetical protein